jgi:haloacetate dehalogenase
MTGERVATRFAKDHPEALDRLVVMDNVPTRIVARDFNPIMAKVYWFFIFNQIPDLPEALITGREDLWLGHLFADWSYNPHTISGEAFDTYVKAYRRPGAVRGALADYRANAEDVAQDQPADLHLLAATSRLAAGEKRGGPQKRNACYAYLDDRASPILMCWARYSRKTRIRIGRSPPCPR